MLHPAAIGNAPAFPLPHPHIIGFGNIFPIVHLSLNDKNPTNK
jgi:hypothetical protein